MKRLIPVFVTLLITVVSPSLAGDIVQVHKAGDLGEASPDQALVYFLRPAMMGKAIKMWAFADEVVLGATKGKTCTFGLVPEGQHVFWSKAENVSALEMEVKAGEVYYLKQAARMGGMKARVKLTQLSAEEGKSTLAKCGKTTTLTDEGRERGAEVVQEYLDRAREKAANRDEEESEE